jgi:hypothetical protein
MAIFNFAVVDSLSLCRFFVVASGMRVGLPALLFACASALAAPAASDARAAIGSGVQAAAPATTSAKIWEGRHAEFEAYIRSAEIERLDDVPIGVTRPKRAFLKPGGPVASVAWKVLPPGRKTGYWESYKSEIAAYELDKLLGMNMVPVAVEKRWKGQTGAAILWLAPIRQWKEAQALPKPPKFNREAILMKMFDNLIGNPDRNMGNLLVDAEWNLFLIDHSRAFIDSKDLPVRMERVDREIWNRMLALDEPALSAALGEWLDGGRIRAILARRDRMKNAIDRLLRTTSEAAVFVR